MLWPFGIVITLISTFLGNTFSLVSYNLLDTEHQAEKKFGKLSFIISLITVIVAFAAYIYNIFNPSVVVQMIFVYCIMSVFIELFPLSPMPGADIKKWNFFVWASSYLFVIASYIYMTLSLYM